MRYNDYAKVYRLTACLVGLAVLALLYTAQAGNGKGMGRDNAGKGKNISWPVMPTDTQVPDERLDSDQDGFPDVIEDLLGTDPQDVQSRPTLADNQAKIFTYWPLMTDAMEALGSGLDGTLFNGAELKDGALKLDGKNDYINFGNNPELSPRGSLSYGLWFQSQGSSGLTRLLGKFSARGKNQEFYALFLAKRLWIIFTDDGAGRAGHVLAAMTPVPVVQKGVWQHLVVTWDSYVGPEGLAVYVNGLPIPLWNVLAPELTSLHAGAADFTLGTFDVMKVGRSQKEVVLNSFKGNLTQLILCKAPLTALEAAELYALGRDGDLPTYLNADFDKDGLPDWWERRYFGNIAVAPDGDEDGDGISNLDEFRADTDPTKPDQTGPVEDSDGDGMPDSWELLYGFNPFDPADASEDADGDGLTNLQEYQCRTHPRQPDTDGDGLPDGWEINWFADLDEVGRGDPDRDGMSNAAEYAAGTDPTRFNVTDTTNIMELKVFRPLL